MWSSVLVLALMTALNPVRFGCNLLVISRPRPVRNLFAYWVGCTVASVLPVLVPLMLVRLTPMLTSASHGSGVAAMAASSTVRDVEIGTGILMLAVAALMIMRFSVPQPTPTPTLGGQALIRVPDSKAPIAQRWLLSGGRDETGTEESTVRRWLGLARNAWKNGSLWVALVFGLGSGPPPVSLLLVLTAILASGATIAAQVSAAILFVIGMNVVVEIMLVGYLAAPVKTEAVLRLLHDWVRAHHRPILVAIFVGIGLSMVAQGIA